MLLFYFILVLTVTQIFAASRQRKESRGLPSDIDFLAKWIDNLANNDDQNYADQDEHNWPPPLSPPPDPVKSTSRWSAPSLDSTNRENQTEQGQLRASESFLRKVSDKFQINLSPEVLEPTVTVQIPDVSVSLNFAPADEYVYVEPLVMNPKASSPTEPPEELRSIFQVMTIIDEFAGDADMKMGFQMEGSTVGGNGLMKQAFSDFGKLISSTRMKTVAFVAGTVDGFVPVPMLCHKVMGFLGAWTALSLQNGIPLAWNFAPIFQNFLFEDSTSQEIDQLIDLIYADLFGMIDFIYSSPDKSYIDLLPRVFKSHRMFNLPEPFEAEPQPFLLELRFLELLASQKSFLARSRRPATIENDKTLYLASLKAALKQNLINGRIEFLIGFHQFFADKFLNNIHGRELEELIKSKPVNVADIISRLVFAENRNSIFVTNDFADELSVPEADRPLLCPEDLMKKILAKSSTIVLRQFLSFVTGSGSLPRSENTISINFCEAAPGQQFCRSRTCFNIFTLVIHGLSAQATFDCFLSSLQESSGFTKEEF